MQCIDIDPESGYHAWHTIGVDNGPDVRCRRCGGRGVFPTVRAPGREDMVLCLRCADEWSSGAAEYFLAKYQVAPKRIRWISAFTNFCTTDPKEVDISSHNAVVDARDRRLEEQFPGISEMISKVMADIVLDGNPCVIQMTERIGGC